MKIYKVLFGFFFLLLPATGYSAERYIEEGARLGKKIVSVLVSEGFCKSARECTEKEVVFGESGDAVYENFYGISDYRLISKVVELIAREGKNTVGDVPIKVSFYSGAHADYMGFASFSKKAFLTMEIE